MRGSPTARPKRLRRFPCNLAIITITTITIIMAWSCIWVRIIRAITTIIITTIIFKTESERAFI